ncbi:hypothetical protein [Novipirellula caenicola]
MAIDVLLGLLNPDRLLPTELCAMIGDWGMTASLFVIPALFIFTPARPPKQRCFAFRIPVAVFTSWFATLEFRMQFNLPALRELASQRGDDMYDGVGMNAALLLMGWFPPLIVTLLMVVVLQFVLAVRRRIKNAGRRSDGEASLSKQNAT